MFVDAKDKKEAAKLVAIYSSQYAKTTQEGLYELMVENDIDLGLLEEIDIPNIDAGKFADSFFNQDIEDLDDEIDDPTEKEKHICPECGFEFF